MINPEMYRNFLVSRIPNAKSAGGGKEVQCRCFYCADSRDKRSHGHFYIGIPYSNDIPSYFYCQKCKTTGIVTHQKLIQWGIYDDNIALDILDHNNTALKTKRGRRYLSRDVYFINNDYVKIDDCSASKLRYFNNRLGLDLSYQDLLDKKIVLNLNDVISRNKLELTRDYHIVNDLDQYFLGFISLDNAFVNMRRLVNPGTVYKGVDLRYVNYALHQKYDNTERFYTVPKSIDLSSPRRIQLHIAEGPFDIMSIYYNLRGQSDDIFTSVAGSNYKGIIRYFITTFRLPYLEIHLYPDNDQYGSDWVMNDIANYIRLLEYPLYIHRNLYPGEKDFGTDISHIDERISRLI